MPWLQGSAEEPENNSSAPQQEELSDAREDKFIADYYIDVDYKPEESNPDIKAVNKEEENSDAE